MMRNPIRQLLLVPFLVLTLAAVGCSEESNPIAPGGDPGGGGGGEEVIETPVSVTIDSIRLDGFPERKGSVTWDASLSVAPRRPDVYVTLRVGSTTSDPIFVSTVDEDAFSFTFIDMSESDDGANLPRTVDAERPLIVSVYDEDGLSRDDHMGTFTFDPIDEYRNDNAAGFSWRLVEGELDVRVSGSWVYQD